MPAHRKPTNVLALHGAFAHNPKRAEAREGEPQGEPVDLTSLPYPWQFNELEQIAWDEVVRIMPAGVVIDSDLMAVTAMVRLYARVLFDEWVDLKVTAQLKGYIAMFGLSPADRSRVKVAAGARPKKTPFDEFAA